jgi:hypothetical protein
MSVSGTPSPHRDAAGTTVRGSSRKSKMGSMEASGRPGYDIRPVLAFTAVLLLSGCATLKEITALRNVDFSLAGTSGGTLAGVAIQSSRSLRDLSPLDVARVAGALSRGELPLEVVLDVRASNPADNVQARLVGMDWTLFLDDKKTVSGALDQQYVLPPGEPVTVPVRVKVDLVEFFSGQLDEIAGLALAVAGAGEPHRVRLEATPVIETRLGPIRYPDPIRIEHQVGG